MRGIIMESDGRKAVLLKSSGEFVQIPDNGYTVGQQVSISYATPYKKLLTAAACFVFAMISFVTGHSLYYTPASFVYMEINPSIRLDINCFDVVINVVPLNNDASVLMEDYDFKPVNTEKCIEKIVTSCKEKKYLNENNNDIKIDLATNNKKLDTKIHQVSEKLREDKLTVEVERIDDETNTKAIMQKTSPTHLSSTADNKTSETNIRENTETTIRDIVIQDKKAKTTNKFVIKQDVVSNKNDNEIKTDNRINNDAVVEEVNTPNNISVSDESGKAPDSSDHHKDDAEKDNKIAESTENIEIKKDVLPNNSENKVFEEAPSSEDNGRKHAPPEKEWVEPDNITPEFEPPTHVADEKNGNKENTNPDIEKPKDNVNTTGTPAPAESKTEKPSASESTEGKADNQKPTFEDNKQPNQKESNHPPISTTDKTSPPKIKSESEKDIHKQHEKNQTPAKSDNHFQPESHPETKSAPVDTTKHSRGFSPTESSANKEVLS